MNTSSQRFTYRESTPEDFDRCVSIRGRTRDNPIPREILEQAGITRSDWVANVESGRTIGVVCLVADEVVGFCNGDTETGEILVLAILPDYEGYGAGGKMLSRVMHRLYRCGFEKLWLAASPDPGVRAHGFYRHLGWVPTGKRDPGGDEILEHRPA